MLAIACIASTLALVRVPARRSPRALALCVAAYAAALFTKESGGALLAVLACAAVLERTGRAGETRALVARGSGRDRGDARLGRAAPARARPISDRRRRGRSTNLPSCSSTSARCCSRSGSRWFPDPADTAAVAGPRWRSRCSRSRSSQRGPAARPRRPRPRLVRRVPAAVSDRAGADLGARAPDLSPARRPPALCVAVGAAGAPARAGVARQRARRRGRDRLRDPHRAPSSRLRRSDSLLGERGSHRAALGVRRLARGVALLRGGAPRGRTRRRRARARARRLARRHVPRARPRLREAARLRARGARPPARGRARSERAPKRWANLARLQQRLGQEEASRESQRRARELRGASPEARRGTFRCGPHNGRKGAREVP